MLSVILHHSFLATPTSGIRTVDPLIERGLTMFIPLAVDLFFVISGFLITSILDRTRVAGLALKQESGSAPKWLVSPVLKSAARYSYGMYVFHLPIIVLLIHYNLVVQKAPVAGFDTPYRLVFFIFIAGLSYGAGLVSWHLYEKRFLKLSPKYRYSRQTPPAEASLQSGVIPVP